MFFLLSQKLLKFNRNLYKNKLYVELMKKQIRVYKRFKELIKWYDNINKQKLYKELIKNSVDDYY